MITIDDSGEQKRQKIEATINGCYHLWSPELKVKAARRVKNTRNTKRKRRRARARNTQHL